MYGSGRGFVNELCTSVNSNVLTEVNVAGRETTAAQSEANRCGSETGYNGYSAKINVGQQNKHIPGTNEYKISVNNGHNKSIMFGTMDDIQELLREYSGNGTPINVSKERVDFGKVIGQYYDFETNQLLDTTVGIIHYGNKGAHVVPARPN